MTVLVILYDVKTIPEVKDYKIAIFISNNTYRTNKFRYLQRKYKTKINVTLSNVPKDLLEQIAVNIAKLFTDPKEPIHLYTGEKCIVY